MGRKLKANNVLCIYLQSSLHFLQIHTDYVTFLFEKIFLRSTKEKASYFRGYPVNASESSEGFLSFLSGGQL